MEVEPRSPQVYTWREGPVRRYHVVFWRQPDVPPEQLPDGVGQERVLWAANENDLLGAEDIVDVLRWVDEEARRRNAIFTLYAVSNRNGRDGLIWLAGWDPTSTGPNFASRQPPDVDPVSGSPAEIYEGRDPDQAGPMFRA